jgi:large conductance mechanosensitive channel
MKSFIDEFKAFAMQGNVVDLAVAVVIGAAFGKIVGSLVEDIIMPLVGLLIGGVNFADLSYKVGDATVSYGVFIQSIVDFTLVAVSIFVVVKAINKAQHSVKKPAEAEAPAGPSEDILLLREIRDSLRR